MLEMLLALSAAVTAVVDLIKSIPLVTALPEATRNLVLLFSSLVVGVIATIGAQANLLADNPVYGQASPMVGLVITGLVVGLGSKALNAAVGLLYGWRDAARSTAGTA